jgi:ribose 5-phosphate isomerase A
VRRHDGDVVRGGGAAVIVAERALDLVRDGDVVGLGTGRAATAFVHALAVRVQAGLRVRGVPTSQATAALATQLGIALTTLEEVMPLQLTVDGADEVDPRLDLIKGYGGAPVREKIVAAASRRLVILVGAEKLVPVLGTRGVLPVEIVPFGLAPCRHRLLELGYRSALRAAAGRPFVTDNGNYILDCTVSPISDPLEIERTLLAIPGVVGTGLFIGMAHTVLVQEGETVTVRERA